MTIKLELVALGFFLLPESVLLEQKWQLTDDEWIEPTNWVLLRDTNSCLIIVADARECCHPCHTVRRAILARNVTSCQHFARSRLTASGNHRYKRLIYADVWPWISFGRKLNHILGVVYSQGSAVLLTEGENFIQDNPVAPSKIRRFQFSLVMVVM